MIFPLFFLALQASAPIPSQSNEAIYRGCTASVKQDAKRAVDEANQWYVRGGGIFARACLGLAYAAQERWEPAAVAFEQAARDAEGKKDARAADLWVQSGNSWLAADNAAKARSAFDAALATTKMTPALRGEIYLDRGRADVALGDLAAARADMDKGLELVPNDPFGWYLSAALALRQEAVQRAQQDIAKAVQMAPDDSDVLLLAGNIAGMSGDVDAARAFYERAIKAEPNSAAAKLAQKQLTENSGATPTEAVPSPFSTKPVPDIGPTEATPAR